MKTRKLDWRYSNTCHDVIMIMVVCVCVCEYTVHCDTGHWKKKKNILELRLRQKLFVSCDLQSFKLKHLFYNIRRKVMGTYTWMLCLSVK